MRKAAEDLNIFYLVQEDDFSNLIISNDQSDPTSNFVDIDNFIKTEIKIFNSFICDLQKTGLAAIIRLLDSFFLEFNDSDFYPQNHNRKSLDLFKNVVFLNQISNVLSNELTEDDKKYLDDNIRRFHFLYSEQYFTALYDQTEGCESERVEFFKYLVEYWFASQRIMNLRNKKINSF